MYFHDRFSDKKIKKNKKKHQLNGGLSDRSICEESSYDENYCSSCLFILNSTFFHCPVPKI